MHYLVLKAVGLRESCQKGDFLFFIYFFFFTGATGEKWHKKTRGSFSTERFILNCSCVTIDEPEPSRRRWAGLWISSLHRPSFQRLHEKLSGRLSVTSPSSRLFGRPNGATRHFQPSDTSAKLFQLRCTCVKSPNGSDSGVFLSQPAHRIA